MNKSTRPSKCECCGKEFSFSDLPQEILSVYRTKDITWVCDDCVSWANKEVRYAQSMSSDIQRTYIKRSLIHRKETFNSSVRKESIIFDPVKEVTNKLYVELLFALFYLVCLTIGSTLSYLLNPTYLGILLTLPLFIVICWALHHSYKSVTRLVNSIIVECNLKGEAAIHEFINISNERLDYVLGKDSSLDAAIYQTDSKITNSVTIKPYSSIPNLLNKKAP